MEGSGHHRLQWPESSVRDVGSVFVRIPPGIEVEGWMAGIWDDERQFWEFGEDQRRTSEIVVSGEIGEFVNVLVSVAAGDIWESGALEIESRSRSVDWSGSGAAVEIKSHVRPVIRGRSGIPNQKQSR